MSKQDDLFPKFQKHIENLIEDEEGNVPGNKLLMLGTMVIILGSLFAAEVQAAHRSHSSHSSHRSHSSHSSGTSGHSNHGSHVSHASHVSHTSHSNTAVHSNSLYSAEGDVSYSAPANTSVPGITTPSVSMTDKSFKLPNINQHVQMPNSTPTSGVLPEFVVPASTMGTKLEVSELHTPSATDKIK